MPTDLFDFLLLRRPTPRDDRTLTIRRIDGNPNSRVIYFLPWNTSLRAARRVGFVPLDFLAAYELPPAVVSSDPGLCVEALNALVQDAENLLRTRSLPGWRVLIVGLSAGTFPATYLANRIGARLCSVASVDRADLAVWHSPATRSIKGRAEQSGIALAHYSEALRGFHPAQNLGGIGPESLFLLGRRDPYVPIRCKAGLLLAIERHADQAKVIELDAGHFHTLRASGPYQLAMLGGQAASQIDMSSLLSMFVHSGSPNPPPSVSLA